MESDRTRTRACHDSRFRCRYPGGPAQRLLTAFLAGRSPQTLRAYRADLTDFAAFVGAATPAAAAQQLLAIQGEDRQLVAVDLQELLAGRDVPDANPRARGIFAARRQPRFRSEFPGPIEITRLFPTTRLLLRLYQPIRGDPKAAGGD